MGVVTLPDSELLERLETGVLTGSLAARNPDPIVIIAVPDGTPVPETSQHRLGTWPGIVLSEPRHGGPSAHLDALAEPGVADLDTLISAIESHPRAAHALTLLQRDAERRPFALGLVAESATYSALLGGAEFAHWLDDRPPTARPSPEPEVLHVTRDDTTLDIVLHRPDVHNALDARLTEELGDHLLVGLVSPALSVRVRGDGPSFCSGGDRREFGTFADPASAHLLRLERALGPRIDALGERISFWMHGACRGSGVELPAFARRVSADPATTFALPEVAMGLIPGAGGTVSITRRIGRLRATTLMLAGTLLDASRALEWGLIDAIGDAATS